MKLINQFNWYRSRYSLGKIVILSVQRIVDRWIMKSRYVFVIELKEKSYTYSPIVPLRLDVFGSFNEIPGECLEQLTRLMPPGRALTFLRHFFEYGARLWIAKINDRIVGLKWTLAGGFGGFFCMPIEETAVVSLAEQVFLPFRGQGLWEEITACILSRLQQEGVSRVYFAVHHKNRSMLRAVKKANIKRIGRVVTFRLPGFHASFWQARYLWSKDNQ